jgi:hypothetical protein
MAIVYRFPVKTQQAAPDRTTWTRSAAALPSLAAGLHSLGVTPVQIAGLGLPLEETLALAGSVAVLEALRPDFPYPA